MGTRQVHPGMFHYAVGASCPRMTFGSLGSCAVGCLLPLLGLGTQLRISKAETLRHDPDFYRSRTLSSSLIHFFRQEVREVL